MPVPIALDERSFDRMLAAYDVAVVDFWARWCRPCREIAPLVERLCWERAEVLVATVDVDRSSSLARRFDVRSVPTLMRFDEGRPTAVAVGALPYCRLLSQLRLDRRDGASIATSGGDPLYRTKEAR